MKPEKLFSLGLLGLCVLMTSCALSTATTGVSGSISFSERAARDLTPLVSGKRLGVILVGEQLEQDAINALARRVKGRLDGLNLFSVVTLVGSEPKSPNSDLREAEAPPRPAALGLHIRLSEVKVVTRTGRVLFGALTGEPKIVAEIDLFGLPGLSVIARGTVTVFSQGTGLFGDTTEDLYPAFAEHVARFVCGRAGF